LGRREARAGSLQARAAGRRPLGAGPQWRPSCQPVKWSIQAPLVTRGRPEIWRPGHRHIAAAAAAPAASRSPLQARLWLSWPLRATAFMRLASVGQRV